jgi:RNA polymerase sigma factor (sigma-70 family)
MSSRTTASRRTSGTLINRVKDLDDDEGWREFFHRYQRLVLSIARQHGLSEAEAEEVAQEVFARVARNIGLFELGARPGAFRRWLGQLTNWCALDARRKRRVATQPWRREGTEDRTATAERIAAPEADGPGNEVSDRDFRDLLLRRLKEVVSPKDYQIYHLITFDGWSPVQVAEHFKIRRGTVDTILCRVRQDAREELKRLGESIV